MRFIALGLSATLLSGCAWFGGGSQGYHYEQGYHHSAQSGGTYAAPYRGGHGYNNGRTHFEGSIGAEAFSGGDFLKSATASQGRTLNEVAMKDVYDTRQRASLGLSHDVASRTTLTAQGFVTKAESKGDIFMIGSPNTLSGQAQQFASVSDYKSYGAEIGFREYANSGRGLRPYIGGTVGGEYVKDIDLRQMSFDGNAASTTTTQLYRGGWVPTASGLVGVEMPVGYRGALALESGIRYTGKKKIRYENTDGGFGEAGDHYAVPIMLRGRYRF